MIYSFENDYSEGCHPQVMAALLQTNLQQTVGYGLDSYSKEASRIIKGLVKKQTADVHLLVGGTQVNLTFISAVLKPYQAIIGVDSCHINVHETGAIEATGHKIITVDDENGKLTVDKIDKIIKSHIDEHQVQPKMIFISQATEWGSVYNKQELEELYRYTQSNNLYLYVDGARLASALATNKFTLDDLSNNCDAFYFGGTKNGALFGEALVILNQELQTDFRYNIKQKGAMLAKGRLLGIQFIELLKDDLYYQIGKHENDMARILYDGLSELGIKFYYPWESNQLFPILDVKIIEKLKEDYRFIEMDQIDTSNKVIRFVTSFNTNKEVCFDFIKKIKTIINQI